MKQKVIFFGSGNYTTPVVEMLKKHGLIYVVTTEKSGAFVNFLKQNSIPFTSTDLKSKEDFEKIKDLNPTLGILASYGVILTAELINIFPQGIINIHPSLLPRHRGPTPIQTTILDGDNTTGVTIHKLDEVVDHGPILAQKEFNLTGHETTEKLKTSLFKLGSEMMDSILQKIEKGEKLDEKMQTENKEYTKKLTRESGFIDLNNPPDPKQLDRMIRAYYPWPNVWLRVDLLGRERFIKLLPENKVQVEGKNIVDYRNFINGYQEDGRRLLEKLGLKP